MFPTGTHHTRPHPLLFTCLLRGNSKYKPSSESRLHICDHRCQSPHICGVSSDNFCFPEKWTEYCWWLAHCEKSSNLAMAVKTQLLQVFTQKRDTRRYLCIKSFISISKWLFKLNVLTRHYLITLTKKIKYYVALSFIWDLFSIVQPFMVFIQLINWLLFI